MNPRSLKLFFVSLQSLSYHRSTVLLLLLLLSLLLSLLLLLLLFLLLHYTPGIRLYINVIKLSQGFNSFFNVQNENLG